MSQKPEIFGQSYSVDGKPYYASLSARELMHRQIALLKDVTFTGSGISLTPFSEFNPLVLARHYAAPGGWFDNDLSRQYLWETTPRDLPSIAAWIESEITNPENCYWLIAVSGAPIGHIGFEFETTEGEGLASNVTYFNGSLAHRRQGHINTAAQVLFDYMRRTRFTRQITTTVAETNAASYAILLSCRPTDEYSGPGGNYFKFVF